MNPKVERKEAREKDLEGLVLSSTPVRHAWSQVAANEAHRKP